MTWLISSADPAVTSATEERVRNGTTTGGVGSAPAVEVAAARSKASTGVALRRVGGLAAQRVPLVVQPDDLGAEVDVEGLLGLPADVEPAQDRRLHHLQRVGGGGRPSVEDDIFCMPAKPTKP